MDEVDFSGKDVIVLSDLHTDYRLYKSCGFRNQALIDAVKKQGKKPNAVIVLNGDIFELVAPEEKYIAPEKQHLLIERTMALIDDLMLSCPDTDIHYNFGNHDNCIEFKEALERKRASGARIFIHDVGIRSGDAIITHGDFGKTGRDVYTGNAPEFFPLAEKIKWLIEAYEAEGATIPNRKTFDPNRRSAKDVPNNVRTKEVLETLQENGFLENGDKYVILAHSHKTFRATIELENGRKIQVINTSSPLVGASPAPITMKFGHEGNIRENGIINMPGYLPMIERPNSTSR